VGVDAKLREEVEVVARVGVEEGLEAVAVAGDLLAERRISRAEEQSRTAQVQ